MKLKELNWNKTCIDENGNYRGINAIDFLYNPASSICILYEICYCEDNSKGKKEIVFTASALSNGQCVMIEDCKSFDEGISICENWRNRFWNDMRQKAMRYIFD